MCGSALTAAPSMTARTRRNGPGVAWNRGALRRFFSINLIEYAWPAVASQQNNGNLYRHDHFVSTALDGCLLSRLARTASSNAGRIERKMIARTTIMKFSFTQGMLPNT